MAIIRGLYNIKPHHQHAVMTIGNFDGVHLGHQKIIKRVRQEAEQLGLPSLAMIFEPLPEEFFSLSLPAVSDTTGNDKKNWILDQPQNDRKVLARLMNLREKYLYFKSLGIDHVLVLRFNDELATLSSDAFIRKVLIDALKCSYVVVGEDFRFGKKRAGDVDYLKMAGQQSDFNVEMVPSLSLPPVSDTGGNDNYSKVKVSSTLIRQLLKKGDFDLANQLLGHPYQFIGKVIHGDARGRELGFPTANIDLKRPVLPFVGIYAVRVKGLDKKYPAVANIGYRPTFQIEQKAILEVHLLDFDQDIYGKQLCVEFIKKIRDERRFDSQEALKTQIFKDIEIAKHLV